MTLPMLRSGCNRVEIQAWADWPCGCLCCNWPGCEFGLGPGRHRGTSAALALLLQIVCSVSVTRAGSQHVCITQLVCYYKVQGATLAVRSCFATPIRVLMF